MMSALNYSIISMELSRRVTALLNMKQAELHAIKWTDGEANIDTGFSALACKCTLEAWDTMRKENTLYTDTRLEISGPDVKMKFITGETTFPDKTELKSGTSKIIPGSTIGKLNINQAMIYCLRPTAPSTTYECRYSQYHTAMGGGSYETFQDRTPRPLINFDKMHTSFAAVEYVHKEKVAWIPHYAACALNRVQEHYNSWQESLTQHIIDEYLRRSQPESILARRSMLMETADGMN
jgi:hypothetical protein